MKNLVALLFLILASSFFVKADSKDLFEKGNQFYEAEKYPEALDAYRGLANQGFDGFNLQFNIGNTYYKMKEIPKAILHYEKALKIDPSNKDVQHNLKLAYAKTTDKIEPNKDLIFNRMWHNTINLFNANGWSWIGILGLFISLVLILIYLFFSNLSLRRLGFFTGVCVFIVSIACLFLAYQQNNYSNSSKSAIIFTPTLSIKSAPGNGGSVLFVLHEGTKVKLLEKSDEWQNVEIPNGNKGWVKVSDLEEI